MRATFASLSERRELPFTCGACGHRATLAVVGVGEGSQSSLNAAGTAEERAKRDLEADFERVRSLARCPSCDHRAPGAALRWWRPHLFWGIGFSGLLAFIALLSTSALRESDQVIARWVCLGLFVFLAGGILGSAALKWSRIGARATFGPAADEEE